MESRGPVGVGPAAGDAKPLRRFDSWKEIAGYFGRDVRTVRRWEKNEALPIHRHVHRSRGSVYAFQHELDEWRARRSRPVNPLPPRVRLTPGALAVFGICSMLALAGGAWSLNRRPGLPSMFGSRLDTAATTARTGAPRVQSSVADPEVRDNFLLARHHLDRRVGFRREAREYLETTIERAPDFAEAHALLGEAHLRQALFDRAQRGEAWSKAEAAVRRALALDAGLGTAHAVLSRILLLRDWNWAAAAAESLRAIELAPDAPDARSAHALYLRSAGRPAEAIVERERAQRADPLNPQWLIALGDEYIFARRYQDAIQAYDRALELERDYRPAVAGLADVYLRAGRPAEAAEWQWRSLSLRGQRDVAAAFDDVRLREGPRAAMDWLDRWNIGQFQRAPDEHLWDLAYTHARLGNPEAAFRFLERAYDQREAGLLQARVDPDLDSLRADPRFADLLHRIGPK